jgi:CheY-like chemotaxis protein
VVDDEPAIRRALRPPLLELGFQVAEASRGEEALQALRARLTMSCCSTSICPASAALRRCAAFAPLRRGCRC